MTINLSNNIKNVEENVFLPIFKLIFEANKSGKTLLNAGVGIPDSDTPELLLNELEHAVRKPENMRYGSFDGKPELLAEISRWLKETYNIDADPKTEIALLPGTKAGLATIASVLLNKGDKVLLPVPSYPDNVPGIQLAGGEIVEVKLNEHDNYLVDYNNIDTTLAKESKIIYLNYPSNPTGAVANRDFYDETVRFAKNNDLIVLQDHAYADFYFKDGTSPAFLASDGAKDVGVELFSFSKNFSISGMRIGFAVGNKDIIKGIKDYNNIFHANIYGATQDTALVALKNYKELTKDIKKTYTARRDKLCSALDEYGLQYFLPEGSIFLWLRVKEGYNSETFFKKLLDDYNLITMPGHLFGSGGENYVRVSLSLKDDDLNKLIDILTSLA